MALVRGLSLSLRGRAQQFEASLIGETTTRQKETPL